MKRFLFFSAGLAAACAYVIAPARADNFTKLSFGGRNYAHRGLHDIKKGIPENSLAAFRAARDHGFGIELDIRLSADGHVIVFHDDNLRRMCGVDAPVYSRTYEQLSRLRLLGTDERIPLFSEVLELMGGTQPLIVELKSCRNRYALCEAALGLIRTYPGDICVESFDPLIIAWFRRNAPDIVRGQLTMRPNEDDRRVSGITPVQSFALSHVVTNCMTRPHFIAHRMEKETFAVRMAARMGAMRFAWTSRHPGFEESYDSVIFEGYMPAPRY